MSESALQTLWLPASLLLIFIAPFGFWARARGLAGARNTGHTAACTAIGVVLALFLYWVAGWALMFGDTAGGAFGTSGFLAALSGAAPAISRMFLFQAALCAAAIALLAGAVAGA